MPRKRSQNREAFWGGLALGTLVLAFLLIFFLADIRRMFTRTDDLYVLMPSAAGLERGSEVWVAGRAVGEVKEIRVRPPGSDSLQRVLVHVEVERRHREHIRRDSEARVTSFSMIGDPVLDIAPGDPAAPAVQENDTLGFRGAGTTAEAIARARSLNESLRELVAESRIVRGHAQDRAALAKRMTDRLSITVRELEAFTAAVQEGPLNTLSDPEFNRVLKSLAETVGELRDTFAQGLQRARTAKSDAEPGLRRLTARADTISQAIGQLQQAIQQGGGGLLTRAMTDSAIVKALHGAQAQLDSLIVETKKAPWRFWLGR